MTAVSYSYYCFCTHLQSIAHIMRLKIVNDFCLAKNRSGRFGALSAQAKNNVPIDSRPLFVAMVFFKQAKVLHLSQISSYSCVLVGF